MDPNFIATILPIVRDGGGLAIAALALWHVGTSVKALTAEVRGFRADLARLFGDAPVLVFEDDDSGAPVPLVRRDKSPGAPTALPSRSEV